MHRKSQLGWGWVKGKFLMKTLGSIASDNIALNLYSSCPRSKFLQRIYENAECGERSNERLVRKNA